MKDRLWLKIIAGMVMGSLFGFALSQMRDVEAARAVASWAAMPGVLFLGMIKMVIIPLVICSIILGGSGSGDAEFVKRLGLRIIPYFIVTTFVAVLIGTTIAEVVKPGMMVAHDAMDAVAAGVRVPDGSLSDLTIPQRFANMIPMNPLKAMVDIDLLQVVIAAIIAGFVVLTVPRAQVQPFLDLCNAGQVMTLKVIDWAMAIAPYAVFGLMTEAIVKVGPQAFAGLGAYVLSVLLGLVLVMGFYLLLVAVVARRSPLEFLRHVREAQLLAFSTSSSAATMPVSIRVAEENLKVHPDVVRFVVPLGATINMDGTALYQVLAALFLCQFFGIDLSFGEVAMLTVTMVGASIGTPSTPGVGIIVLSTIVAGLGVPPEGIGMILGVDRILDMCRTTVNVSGDLTASTVMERWLHTGGVHAAGVRPI